MPLGNHTPRLQSRIGTTICTETNKNPSTGIVFSPMSIKITPHVFNKFVLQILRVKEIKSSLHDVYSESSPIPKILPLYFKSSVWKHNTSPSTAVGDVECFQKVDIVPSFQDVTEK